MVYVTIAGTGAENPVVTFGGWGGPDQSVEATPDGTGTWNACLSTESGRLVIQVSQEGCANSATDSF
jgi:hypothetical protein